MEDLSDYPSLFFSRRSFFFFSYYILFLNLFDITKSFLFTLCPFSTSQFSCIWTSLSFLLLPFLIPLPRPRNEEYKNERFYDGVEMSIFAFSRSFNLLLDPVSPIIWVRWTVQPQMKNPVVVSVHNDADITGINVLGVYVFSNLGTNPHSVNVEVFAD